MFGLPKEAVGATLAAAIAGLISLLGLIISKEQKVSEFRQAWIDALRQEVGQLITHTQAIRGIYFESYPARPAWKKVSLHYVAVNQAITCIRLRLNPNEEKSKLLLVAIDAIENEFHKGDIGHSTMLVPFTNDLTERCRLVMKEEWERVQRGEETYRVAKQAAYLAIILSLGVLFSMVIISFLQGGGYGGHPQSHTSVMQRENVIAGQQEALAKPSCLPS